MYVGKHEQRRKKRRSNRSLVLTISVIALVVCIVGASLAYLFTKSAGITNTFTPTKVTTDIVEKLDKGVKRNVTIKNTGDIEAFVRAKVVITWKDSSGNVYGTAPVAGTDYSITYNSSAWELIDGIYYCKTPVAPNGSSPVLISECEKLSTAVVPENYDLSVEIIAEAIQSKPADVVQQTWGVTIANGSVTAYTAPTE